jgi:hypothetical protein
MDLRAGSLSQDQVDCRAELAAFDRRDIHSFGGGTGNERATDAGTARMPGNPFGGSIECRQLHVFLGSWRE